MNSQTTVKLTSFGKAKYIGLFDTDPGDILILPLWELMQIFGPGIHMGMTEMYFVDNEVEIIE